MADGPAPRAGSRRLSWRAAMASWGVGCAAAGACLVVWPHLLAYAVAAGLALLGLALLVSAAAAR